MQTFVPGVLLFVGLACREEPEASADARVTPETLVPSGRTLRVPGDLPTIQAGLDAAASGDTVLVAPGVYRENVVFKRNGVALVSEQGARSTEIRGHGGVVVTAASATRLDTTTRLEGFTVTGGTGGYDGEGGGVRLWNHDMTFRNNIFMGNTANEGGGLYLEKSSAVVDNNVIQGNRAEGKDGNGGGIFCFADYGGPYAPVIRNNTIRGNSASGTGKVVSGGGAIAVVKVHAVIEHNLITGNRATDGVGGIALFGQAWEAPVVRLNTISDNGEVGIDLRGRVDARIEDNDIVGHRRFGVAQLLPLHPRRAARAERNWWGDASGPRSASENPDAKGDPVSDGVAYRPWLTRPAPDNGTNGAVGAL